MKGKKNPEYWYVEIINNNLTDNPNLVRNEEAGWSDAPKATFIKNIRYEIYQVPKDIFTGDTIMVTKTHYARVPIIVESIDDNYVKDVITGDIYIDATNIERNIVINEEIVIVRKFRILEDKLARYLRLFALTDSNFIRYEKAIELIRDNLSKGIAEYNKKKHEENADSSSIEEFKRTHHKKY